MGVAAENSKLVLLRIKSIVLLDSIHWSVLLANFKYVLSGLELVSMGLNLRCLVCRIFNYCGLLVIILRILGLITVRWSN
jgi:hypothetical protein